MAEILKAFQDTLPENLTFDQEPVVNNDGISFADIPQSTLYPEDTANVLAKKYNFAVDIPIEEAKAALISGDEKRLREISSDISRIRTEAARFRMVEMGMPEGLTTPSLSKGPEIAFEEEFGARIATSVPGFFNASSMDELMKNPDLLDMYLQGATEGYTKKEAMASVFHEWLPKIKDSSIAGSWTNVFTSDFAEIFVPYLSMYRLNQTSKKFTDAGIMSSTNLEELVGSVYRLPIEEGRIRANEIMQDLFSKNVYDAANFLAALDSYTTSDAYWDNVFDVIQLPTTLPTLTLKYAYKKASNFIRPEAIKMSGIVEAAGDLNLAARYKVTERLQELTKTAGVDAKSIETLMENTPTISNPSKVITPSAALSSRQSDRMVAELQVSAEKLFSTVSDTISVKRLDEGTEALKTAYDEAEAAIKQRLGHVSGAILDVRPINADSNILNVAAVEARLGKATVSKPKVKIELNPDISVITRSGARDPINLTAANQNKAGVRRTVTAPGKPAEVSEYVTANAANKGIKVEIAFGDLESGLFESQKQALKHAEDYYGLPKGSFNIIEEAPGRFYISVVKQIDETTPSVRKALIENLRGKEPNDWRSAALRKLGSAEELNSKSMSANRKIAAHGTSDILSAMAKHLEDNIIKPLSKDGRTKFNAFITKQRNFESPKGDILGRFSKNQAEFEVEWRQIHGVNPDYAESLAYWKYVQMSDIDHSLRNMSRYTQMSQEGWEMVGLSTNQFKMKKPLIEGKIVPEVPDHPGFKANVIRWDESGQHEALNKKRIIELQAQGYKIVKLHSEGMRKISSAEGLNVPAGTKYILTNKVQQAPLTLERVAYRPGGHRVHIDDWFVSIEDVKLTGKGTPFESWRYKGDYNISSHMVREQAQKMVDILNKAREIYKGGDHKVLDRFIIDNFPSTFTPAKFKRLFEKDGLNVDTPFKLRRKDQNLADSYDLRAKYRNFIKEADDPHYLDEALEDTAFVGRREPNLPSYTFEGTAHNPVIRVGTSNLLDPLSTLARSTMSSVRNLYMDDMKIKHAQDFVARYGDLLDIPNAAEAQYNPLKHTLSTPFKEGVTDLRRLDSAKAYRESIKNFINIDSTLQTEVKTFRDKMLSGIYDRFGLDKALVAEQYLPHKIVDPVKFLRAAAFHSKIGLFNIPSFMTQVMQYTTMMGIAGPLRAGEALAWGQYAKLMRHASPDVQKAIARKAGEWGGTSTDFMDYYDAMKRSGIMTVRGEIAELDDDKAFKVVQSTFGKILDWGRYPFEAGERVSRSMAFQIAYREWRANAKHSLRPTDDDLRTIVGRADLLTGNMTRASIMSWQKGFLSLPSQFLNWHIRMTEQMLGKSLTPGEKTQLMLTNAVLYGAPAGLATAPLIAVVPWKDAVTNFMASQGFSPEDSIVSDAIINGILSSFSKAVTGDRFNISERYGPGSINPIYERILNSEEAFIVTATGVAGSTIQDMARLSIPLIANISSRVGFIEADIGLSDIKEELDRVVSSMGSAERALAIINTGQYLSKNEKLLTEVDNWKGYVLALTGLQPEAVSQTASKQSYLNLIKWYHKLLEPRMLAVHREMYDAGQQGDLRTMERLEKKLKSLYVISGMSEEERAKFEYRALQGLNKSWADRVDKELMKRNETQYRRIIREQERNAQPAE